MNSVLTVPFIYSITSIYNIPIEYHSIYSIPIVYDSAIIYLSPFEIFKCNLHWSMAFVLSAIKWQQDKTGRSLQLQFVLIACLQRKVKQWLEFAVNEQTLRAWQIYLGATARRFEILQPVPVVQFARWAKSLYKSTATEGVLKQEAKLLAELYIGNGAIPTTVSH